MSRRRRATTDPIGSRAFDETDTLFQVLDTLSERERAVILMRFGLAERYDLSEQWGIVPNGPMTLYEIGQVLGLPRELLTQIEERAMRKLRHPSRSKVLMANDHNGKPLDFIDVARKHRATTRDLFIYERWKANLISCAHCGKQDFATRGNGGRPRRYCSNKCRQAAYRARRASADA
jgi:hypothetical protein